MTDMTQVFNSMENTLRLQNRARAERRARKALQEQKEFQEKLRRASAGALELEMSASKVRGAEDAVRRDQLMGLLGAGV